MKFRTEITLPAAPFAIDHSTGVMLLGSCFSDNIGQRMADRLMDVEVNPFGQLYNPLSIERAAALLTATEELDGRMIVEHAGQWHSLMHHSRFSDDDRERLMARIGDSLSRARLFMCRAQTVIITLGTAYCYFWRELDAVVANCHKLPADKFDRRMISPVEAAGAMKRSIALMRSVVPELNVVLTVSPIRHFADGFERNSLSKAILRVAVDSVAREVEGVVYFPAYEIMNDDLRDYRFYAGDMCHPSEQAADYIFEKFADTFFSPQTLAVAKQCHNFVKFLRHRPLTRSGEAQKEQEVARRLESISALSPRLGVVAARMANEIVNPDVVLS